jgi:hypothetical protein
VNDSKFIHFRRRMGIEIIALAPFFNSHPHHNDDFHRFTWTRRNH